jgi:hypothetical protein
MLKLNSGQFDELVSLFTVPENIGEDSREKFSENIPPIDATDAEGALKQAIELAEPDRNRNIVGFLLACKLRGIGLTMTQSHPYMILYWKALHKTGGHLYEKWETKSSLRSAYKNRWAEFENVGFYHILETLYVQNRQPEHNCVEYHNNSELTINLKKGTGTGRHGKGDRLDCPGCIWELARAVTLDLGANLPDGFWAMALPLIDKKAMEALEKRVREKKDGTGAGIGLTSLENSEIGIATNYQADERMEFIPWTDTEKVKEFLAKYLSLEPNSKGKGKHKIRPFGAFIRRDVKYKGDGESYKLKIPGPWKEAKEGLTLMGCTIKDEDRKSFFTLSKTAINFFKGIILNDWSGVQTMPLPADNVLWKAVVYRRRKKGKIKPIFSYDSPDTLAEKRLDACRVQVEATA